MANSPIEPKGEDRLINKFLAHHIIEWRHNPINWYFLVSHSKETIKLCSNECNSRYRFGFTKSL